MKKGRVIVRWPEPVTELRLPPGTGTPGETLATRLTLAGHTLNTRCGQRGTCAGCTVKLLTGAFQQADGRVVFGPTVVKACQGDVPPAQIAIVAVPARSVASHAPRVVTSFKLGVSAAHAPMFPVAPGVCDHGLAIDLGTTTVVVALVDLATGRIVAEEGGFNQQIELGEDVITRIGCGQTPYGREALRAALVERTLGPLLRKVLARAALPAARVAGVVAVGNTAMLHFLTGADPTTLGVAPFRAAFLHHRILTAGGLKLAELPEPTPVHLLPGLGAYVGADLVAGCVCTGLINTPGPALLVDLGTNGEIVLWHAGQLWATATAAGPAFEGGRLARGVRAAAGAVTRVDFPPGGGPPRLEVIPGAAEISGLCGSAYVDFLAQARTAGWLDANGRWEAAAWREQGAGERIDAGNARGLRLVPGNDATLVTEADVAELLQAKAALAAGITTLLQRAGLQARQVARLYLAGGFGLHVDVGHAIACGLLPGFTPEQVELVGNTALGGAWLALVDRTALLEMTALGPTAILVELNREPGFENNFIDQLALP
jgi:uncharacterized 2Fe-2S/4Fe-4S cluster protein (DUF4445 family)